MGVTLLVVLLLLLPPQTHTYVQMDDGSGEEAHARERRRLQTAG